MKKNNNELKAITITKRTCSDINQLFSELSAELSEEYLHTDDPAVTENIKKALLTNKNIQIFITCFIP